MDRTPPARPRPSDDDASRPVGFGAGGGSHPRFQDAPWLTPREVEEDPHGPGTGYDGAVDDHLDDHLDDRFVGPARRADARRSRDGYGTPHTATVNRRAVLGLAGTAAAAAATAAVVLRPGAGALEAASTSAPGAGPTAGAAMEGGAATAAGSTPAGSATAAARASGMVGAGKAAVATTKAGTDYQAAATGRAPKVAAAPRKPKQPPTILPLDPALHLGRRATFGLTPALITEIRTLGTRGWLDRQLRPARIPDTAVTRMLQPFDTLGRTPAELRGMNKDREKQDYWYAHSQLELAAILRATWSERQLYEMTVDFFHSRLHVPARFDKSRDSLNHYDVAVIRKHAFGKFADMVWAMVTHPAMLLYLDNQNNTKDNGGNQNLGRELLQLHTLGVDAGYTQKDVEAAARLLTGFSVDGDSQRFVYRPEQHFVGRTRVFGRTYANASAQGGVNTLKALVRDLTRHPRTAHYLAQDLARRFVSDAPSEALVRKLAATYLKYDTAIVPVLKALFLSPEFAASVGQKYRRPFEYTVASMRSLGLRPGPQDKLYGALGDIRYNLERANNSPLGHVSPDGYADFSTAWLSSLGTLSRWNMAMSLSGGWRDGFTKADVDRMLAGASTYGAAVDRLIQRLTFQKPTAKQRAALLIFLQKKAGDALTDQARRDDYNLRVRVPALILSGPHSQLR